MPTFNCLLYPAITPAFWKSKRAILKLALGQMCVGKKANQEKVTSTVHFYKNGADRTKGSLAKRQSNLYSEYYLRIISFQWCKELQKLYSTASISYLWEKVGCRFSLSNPVD